MDWFGALGDIHGDFAAARRVMDQHPEVAFWLCVGDVADGEGRYEALPARFYWIKGNNENFDAIDAGELPMNLLFVPNGRLETIEGVRVIGLGGTFAPTWYEITAAALPHPKKRTLRATAQADKRRHFLREEVEACKAQRSIDVFLSHEAPRPFKIGGIEAGKTAVNEIIETVTPRLHLFGHHHRFTERDQHGVRSVGLDVVSKSYLLIDRATMEYDVRS